MVRSGATEAGNGAWWVFVTILVLVAAIPMVKAVRRRFRLRRLQTGDIVAGWHELTDRLRDLGAPVAPNLTPVEVAKQIDQGIAPLAARVTASVYGRRQIDDGRSALRAAENALRNRYSRARWWLSWFRPETLFSGLSIRRLRLTRRIRPTRPAAES